MEMSAIKNMSRSELLSSISARKNEIAEKLQKGETQESFEIGGSSFTNSEWDKLISKVDSQIDEIKEEQKLRKEKQEEQQEAYEVKVLSVTKPEGEVTGNDDVVVPGFLGFAEKIIDDETDWARRL